MRKILSMIVIGVILLGVLLCFGMKYHASMNMTDKGGMINPDAVRGPDGEYILPEPLDGDGTYVDNEKLLQQIVGDWVSEDGQYHIKFDLDSLITISADEKELLKTRVDFVYLQPGTVQQTEMNLENREMEDIGTVEELYHSVEAGMERMVLTVCVQDAHAKEKMDKIIEFHPAR